MGFSLFDFVLIPQTVFARRGTYFYVENRPCMLGFCPFGRVWPMLADFGRIGGSDMGFECYFNQDPGVGYGIRLMVPAGRRQPTLLRRRGSCRGPRLKRCCSVLC